MSDQDFRDFVASHVVLEEEPGPMKGEVAAKAVTEAFGKFDKVGKRLAGQGGCFIVKTRKSKKTTSRCPPS